MSILDEKLARIRGVFDINKIVNRSVGVSDIQKYYKVNVIPYFLFCSKDDFVHNGISRSGEYSDNDGYEHPKTVKSILRKQVHKNAWN